MDNHPGKMEVCQIERKNAIEWKPIKFKKQRKLARLKTRKGGLSKSEKKKKSHKAENPKGQSRQKLEPKNKKSFKKMNERKKKKESEWSNYKIGC